MVVYLGNAGGDENIEGNRGAVVLRHVGGDGVAAHLVLRFEHTEIEPFRVVAQRPGHTQPRNSPTDYSNSFRRRRVFLAHSSCFIIDSLRDSLFFIHQILK